MAAQRKFEHGCAALGIVSVQGACVIAGWPRCTRGTLCACPLTDPYRDYLKTNIWACLSKGIRFYLFGRCTGGVRLGTETDFRLLDFSTTETKGPAFWGSGHGLNLNFGSLRFKQGWSYGFLLPGFRRIR